MKKMVRFELQGRVYEVGVERTGDRLTLTHEGERYTISLLPDDSVPAGPPTQSPAQASPAAAMPQISTPTIQASPAAAPTAELDSTGVLHAPMTGVIKEIKVGPGHAVEEGQVVLIMEAMKMDIDVPSPAAGIVVEVSVKAGDTVNAKQQLMVIH